MGDRDDANLKHFRSRSQQPKVLAEGPAAQQAAQPVDITLNLVFDSGFGGHSHEMDDLRFRHMGTSPAWSMYGSSCARRNGQNCMRSGFGA